VQLNYDRLRVVLHASLLVSGGDPRSVLHGTQGSWAKFGADVQERQLMSGMLPDDPSFGYDPDPGIMYDGATGTRTVVPSPAGNESEYYVGIRDAILGKCPASVLARGRPRLHGDSRDILCSGRAGSGAPLSALTRRARRMGVADPQSGSDNDSDALD
jgi:hypothetical protein